MTVIVLVHGGFADASSWAPVTRLLLEAGHDVRVPAVPNRSLVGDARHVRGFVEQLRAPVLLVGHAYGGAVITVAGVADNVVGLVYVAGYALRVDESLGQLQGGFPDSDLAANLVYEPFTLPDGTYGTDVSVRIDAFPSVIAAGVDETVAAVLAVSQRPLAALAFSEVASQEAWSSRPTWGLVTVEDHAVDPDVQRFGYRRAGARRTVEVAGAPHLVMHQNPYAVVDLITEALAGLGA